MSAVVIGGKRVAEEHLSQLAAAVEKRKRAGLRPPGLAVVLVGQDPASEVYVRSKRAACAKVGFHSEAYDLPETISEAELLTLIDRLNESAQIDGILVQLPLPPHISNRTILDRIRPEKDVDGFHPDSLGRLLLRFPSFRPCTAFGVMQLLDAYDIQTKGKAAVVVGASNHVGRPMAVELLNAGATVTICHRFTKNLAAAVQLAEVVVAAVGLPRVVKTEWLRPGVVLVDVGFTRLANGKISGDFEFATAREVASFITPVPGGVGPMTIAALLQNTLQACECTR